MFSEDGCLGCPTGLDDLRSMNSALNAKVMAQINDCQELTMLNTFARESSEYQFKKYLQERIADIASWRWVLEDLSKRLEEIIDALKYEHNALRVVVQRVNGELNDHSREHSRPGALNPKKDFVEEAILEEHNFLREEKKKFENLIPVLDKQTGHITKIKKRIDVDLTKKKKAIDVEESCANIDNNTLPNIGSYKKKKSRFSPVTRWENRCMSLKRAGLSALSSGIISRQQVRGARVHLSIAAQAYATKVDSALRKRLHINTLKLQELEWQREEALRDIQALDEELTTTEKNLLETMDQERVLQARVADRSLRPVGEVTRDRVDRKLRDELARLKHLTKTLRSNITRITSLQNNLTATVTQIDCRAEDIAQVMRVDQDRISWRLGEGTTNDSTTGPSEPQPQRGSTVPPGHGAALAPIMEDDEEIDDYPFDD